METGKANTAKKSTKIKTTENDPKHSLTEILREILIGLKEEVMEISESTKELSIEQKSKARVNNQGHA